MSSHRSFAPVSLHDPGSNLESPVVQPWESVGSPIAYEELTVPGPASSHDCGDSRRPHGYVVSPHVSLTGWSSSNPYEFVMSRITRPKCASTTELFGHLPGYGLQHVQPSLQEEEDRENDGDYDQDSSTKSPSPLKKRQRKKLRESAGVKHKPPKKRATKPSAPKTKASLPPAGRMRCLWGDDCTIRMGFDYTLDTIKDWKIHVASHIAKPGGTMGDSAGGCQKARMVTCSWGGCGAEVERGYLFKHIVTHEVRFKLLCPYGCEVAIRDDNLDRHLRSCRASD